MKALRWLIVLSPILLGTGLALYFNLSYNNSPPYIVYLKADLGTLSFILGVLLSMVLTLIFSLNTWKERVYARINKTSTEEHHRFLHRLDHELKNPLTAIRAGLANLVDLNSSSAAHKTLDILEAETQRLSRLSSDLRKLAEIEVRSIESLPVNIPSLLQEAFQLVKEQPGAAERTLNLILPRAPWPIPPIQGDADLLFMAVYNLLDNALKFSKPGDMIELHAFEDGQDVIIEVADTGQGIPEDEQPHVWEELYRGKAGRGIPGSGLGLALVRIIIDRHGGTVAVRSRIDQGTVFTLRLPTR